MKTSKFITLQHADGSFMGYLSNKLGIPPQPVSKTEHLKNAYAVRDKPENRRFLENICKDATGNALWHIHEFEKEVGPK